MMRLHSHQEDTLTEDDVLAGLTHLAEEEAEGPATEVPFDPLRDLLIAQKERPAHLAEVNLRTLTPFQRALLVIDGTVTKFIEAYTMEPIEVVLLDQAERELTADHAWLEVSSGSTVITRQVLLRGRYNQRLYAYAVSLLVVERLPAPVRANLRQHPGGLGRILLEHQLETRRDVLWYGRERIRHLPDPVGLLNDERFISRTYRIVAGGAPLMLINEKFPFQTGRQLQHH